jgi:hypothetical protein
VAHDEPARVESSPQCPLPIDVDAFEELPTAAFAPMPNEPQKAGAKRCQGIRVNLPPGKSPHTSYPFGIHDELGDPWDYAVTNGALVLRSKLCTPNSPPGRERCRNCTMLAKNPHLEGILRRMEMGVHENTPLVYHSVGSLVSLLRRKQGEIKALRLRKLNDAHKLAGKAVAIDNLKQWVMAVGSGKVERVDRLVRANLARKGGIRNLLDLYDRAAQQVYHPRNYTEEDELRGLLLWRLGGARVAGIAHRALNLPSLGTLQRRTRVPRLVVSPSMPTTPEVEANITSCFETLSDVLSHKGIVHQVLMLDELKVEERPRFDDESNKIIGLCREHGRVTSLEYNSEKEVDLLLDAIEHSKVHLATEVRASRVDVT